MIQNEPPSTKNQIKTLLLVIFSGIFLGIFVLAYMLYYHGPTGNYKTDNILIAPDMLTDLNYSEGKNNRFILHKIEFTALNPTDKKWQVRELTANQYKKIYDLVSNHTSISSPGRNVEELFARSKISSLQIFVKNDSNKQPITKLFEEVQFSPDGNYFRVRVPTDSYGAENWAYFHSPGILNDVNSALTDAT